MYGTYPYPAATIPIIAKAWPPVKRVLRKKQKVRVRKCAAGRETRTQRRRKREVRKISAGKQGKRHCIAGKKML